MILYNSGRDKMLASLFKAHELMETRIKPLRVPFGEIHVLNRTLENIASCYVDVASFLRTNEATELSHQDRSAVRVFERGVTNCCLSRLLNHNYLLKKNNSGTSFVTRDGACNGHH